MNSFLSNEKQQEIFNKVSNNPIEYLRMADKLKYSAETILNEYKEADEESKRNINMTDIIKIGLDSIYLMLIGYAFENILKGIYISLGEEFLKWSSNGHNLEAIVEDINVSYLKTSKIQIIKLNKTERELLKKLKVYAEGKGRYPTLKKLEKVDLDKYDLNAPFHPELRGYNEKFETRTYQWYNPTETTKTINELFNKCRNLLEARC